MLLTGTYHRTLDEKHRFSIPKPLRESLQRSAGKQQGETESALYLTPGTDGSLALYAESVLAEIGDRLGAHSPIGVDVRTFSRLFYAQAHRVDLDRQGRVRIPTELVRWANLDREIVMLGVRDHLEIWEGKHWQDYLDANQMHFDQIAEQAFKPSFGADASLPTPAFENQRQETQRQETQRQETQKQGIERQAFDAEGKESHAAAPDKPR